MNQENITFQGIPLSHSKNDFCNMGFHHQIGNNIGSQGAAPYLLAKRIALSIRNSVLEISLLVIPM
jgi:hypothetical protein